MVGEVGEVAGGRLPGPYGARRRASLVVTGRARPWSPGVTRWAWCVGAGARGCISAR